MCLGGIIKQKGAPLCRWRSLLKELERNRRSYERRFLFLSTLVFTQGDHSDNDQRESEQFAKRHAVHHGRHLLSEAEQSAKRFTLLLVSEYHVFLHLSRIYLKYFYYFLAVDRSSRVSRFVIIANGAKQSKNPFVATRHIDSGLLRRFCSAQ
jgi:hypothetical protein